MSGQVQDLKLKGARLRDEGRLRASIASYQLAVQLAPDDLEAHYALAEVCVWAGERNRAVLAYQRVAGRYAADGELLKAIAICKRILELAPSHTETSDALAALYAKREETAPTTASLPPRMSGAISKPKLQAVSVEDAKAVQATTAPPTPTPVPNLALTDEALAMEIVIEADDADLDIEWEPVADETAFDLSSLPDTPLFCDLTKDDFISLLHSLEVRHVDAGTRLLTEGDVGETMFILVQGGVSVFRERADGERHEVATLDDGAFFGEMALIGHAPRLTCVETTADSLLLVLTQAQMRHLAEVRPLVGDVALELYKRRLLDNLLDASPLFRAFNAEDKRAIISAFAPAHVGPGVVIVEKGQAGAGLYLVLRGACEVVEHDADGEIFQIAPLREGDVFGEISMVRRQPAIATVRTLKASHLLRLDPNVFYERVMRHPEVEKELRQLSEDKIKMTTDLLLAAGVL